MIFGFKGKSVGKWSFGIEFGTRLAPVLPEKRTPFFEVFCFKLLGIPTAGGFKKERDIMGFWKILWWQPSEVKQVDKLHRRKGFREKIVKIPVKIKGRLRLW